MQWWKKQESPPALAVGSVKNTNKPIYDIKKRGAVSI